MGQDNSENLRKGIVLNVLGAFWGAFYLIPYKAAVQEMSPEMLVLPMLLCAAGLNTFYVLLVQRANPWQLDGTALWVGLLLGVFSALGNEAMAHALVRVDPGLAAVLLRVQVFIVAAGGYLFLGEKVTLRFWLGVFLAMIGFVILTGAFTDIKGASLAGMAWVVLAALMFASMQILIRKTIKRIDPLVVNSLRLWIACLLMACVPGRPTLLLEAPPLLWFYAAAAALLGPVISRIFLMLALRHVKVAVSTLILFSAPVFAFALAGLFFQKWPGLLEVIGSLVILAGIGLPVLEMLGQIGKVRKQQNID